MLFFSSAILWWVCPHTAATNAVAPQTSCSWAAVIAAVLLFSLPQCSRLGSSVIGHHSDGVNAGFTLMGDDACQKVCMVQVHEPRRVVRLDVVEVPE